MRDWVKALGFLVLLVGNHQDRPTATFTRKRYTSVCEYETISKRIFTYGIQRYRLRMQIKPGDFFEVTKALERLNERSAGMETTMTVIATAKPGQPFNANMLHNLVVEPMVEESDVMVLEEQVEE